jgi:hypothetical protein
VISGSFASSPKAVAFSKPTKLKTAIFTPIAIPESDDPLSVSCAVSSANLCLDSTNAQRIRIMVIERASNTSITMLEICTSS